MNNLWWRPTPLCFQDTARVLNNEGRYWTRWRYDTVRGGFSVSPPLNDIQHHNYWAGERSQFDVRIDFMLAFCTDFDQWFSAFVIHSFVSLPVLIFLPSCVSFFCCLFHLFSSLSLLFYFSLLLFLLLSLLSSFSSFFSLSFVPSLSSHFPFFFPSSLLYVSYFSLFLHPLFLSFCLFHLILGVFPL